MHARPGILQKIRPLARKVIWASTTQTPVSGAPLEDFVRYNDAARAVMEEDEQGVQINDLHAFSLPRLDDLQVGLPDQLQGLQYTAVSC